MRLGIKRAVIIPIAILGLVILLLTAAIVVVTNTDYGRELVRSNVVKIIQENTHGVVRMGEVTGNLLTGFTIRDFSITDSAGAPFVRVGEGSVRYALKDLVRKRLWLRDVKLVNALIVLDRKPGQPWNYKKLWPADTTTPKDTTKKGADWEDLFQFRDVQVDNGHIIVMTPWKPSEDKTPAQQDSSIADALAGRTRMNVVRADSGFQKISDFRAIYGTIPRFVLDDPEIKGMVAEISKLQMTAEPFLPPALVVKDVKGTMRISSDSLWWYGVQAELPGTSLVTQGAYYPKTDGLVVRARSPRLALADLRWVHPPLPANGGGSLDFSMVWNETGERYVAENANVQIEDAKLAGRLDLTMLDSGVVFDSTRLEFSRVDTRLLEQIFEGLESPRRGTLGGRLALDGSLDSMRVDGDVTFDDVAYGRSRVVATGEFGGGEAGWRTRGLQLRLMPVQAAMARAFKPDLPIGGTVTGTITVNGSAGSWLGTNANLVHVDRGARSHVTGQGEIRLKEPMYMDFDLRARPISLVEVGRFMPAIGLRGDASGPIKIRGTLRNLLVDGSLAVSGGGNIEARGRLDLESEELGYDLAIATRLFDANAVVAKAPRTELTATATARGRGFDPATMQSEIVADLQASAYDTLARIDSAKVRVTIANGLARIDTVSVRMPGAAVDVAGTFGMAAGHEGELVYRAAIDSLRAFERWIGTDTAVTAPRPLKRAQAIAQARADSARVARVTEVERAVTGQAGPVLAVPTDTPVVVRHDSLSGKVYAAGTIKGALPRFDLRGRASLADLAVHGNTVERARIEYGWLNARTPQSTILLAAHADSLSAAGFALDSVETRLSYGGDSGTVVVAIHQDTGTYYGANARFSLHAEHNELHLDELRLQFDTTLWRSTRPGAIQWGARGIDIETIELRSGTSGRIYVNGLLPKTGAADLEVAVDNFQIGDVMALVQSDVDVRGFLTVAARLQGTTAAPVVRLAGGASEFSYDGATLPEIRVRADYAGELLTAHADVTRRGGQPMIVADGTIPINLALTGVTGDRLPDREIKVDITADSLPLDLLPKVLDVVSEVRGHAHGEIAVRGTARKPALAGALMYERGFVRIVPLGVAYRDIAASIKLRGDSVVIDSLVGISGGTVRLAGGIGVKSLTAPSFDLRLNATNARVIDNDIGRARADAQISMFGPFDNVYVSGLAHVRNGVFYLPESDGKSVIGSNDPALFSVVDTALASSRELFPAESPLLEKMRMDLSIRIDRDVWVRSKEANVEIYSDGDLRVHVDRAKRALALEGIISTERGQYTFLSKRFVITRGSATFIGSPELNPTIQASAQYEVRLPAREALNIQLLIGGTMRSLRLTLQSDAQPPIAQSDLLAYLAFGRSSSSLLQLGGSGLSGGGGGGGLAGTAGAFATQQLTGIALGVLTDELEGEAATALGADVFNITAADAQSELFSGNAGSFLRGTEVEFGRYLNNNESYLGLQGRLHTVIPGVLYQRRMGKGLRLEMSVEPRYELRQPTLTISEPAKKNVVGIFLVREWRY